MKTVVKKFNLITPLGESNIEAEFQLIGLKLCLKNNEETRCRYIQIIRFLDKIKNPDDLEKDYISKILQVKNKTNEELKDIVIRKLNEVQNDLK
jgi:hypothetical protein